MGISQAAIDRFLNGAGALLGRDRDLAFAALVLREAFGLEDSRALRQVGNSTIGINGFHLDPERRNLYLIAAHWSDRYQSLEGSIKELIERWS
jgi:hypothetical protein